MPLLKIVDEGFKLVVDGNTALSIAQERELDRVFGQRGGRICFQAVFQAKEAAIFNLSEENWFSQKGKIAHYRLEAQGPYPIYAFHEQMHTDDDGNLRADALLSHPVKELRANEPAAAFFEMEIPADAELSEGEIRLRLYESRLTGDESISGEWTLPLRIYPLLQTEPKNRSLYLDLWFHPCNVARKHETPLWSDAHFRVMEGYARALASLGQSSITVLLSDAPWRGQSCIQNFRNPSNLFEYSMVPITRKKDGSLFFDFSVLDRYIALFERCGIKGEIECFGLVNIWQNPVFEEDPPVKGDVEPQISLRAKDETTGAFAYLRKTEEIEEYLRAVEAHFAQTGRLDRVCVAADEPADPEKFKKTLERLHRCAPRLRLRTAINHADFIGRFSDEIDEFVPYLECACKEYDTLLAYKKEMPDKRFLWYVCCAPDHPNNYLRSKLLESRLIGPMTHWMKLDGFLRWSFTVWPDDPRKDIRYGSFAAGDTGFVYPGNDGNPLLTLRYKALQRGFEDHQLLQEADAETAKQALSLIFKKDSAKELLRNGQLIGLNEMCSLAYEDFEKARELLLQRKSEK